MRPWALLAWFLAPLVPLQGCSSLSAEVVKLDQVVQRAKPKAEACQVAGGAIVAVASGVASELGAGDVVAAVGRLVVLTFCEVYAVVKSLRQDYPAPVTSSPIGAATLRSALSAKVPP